MGGLCYELGLMSDLTLFAADEKSQGNLTPAVARQDRRDDANLKREMELSGKERELSDKEGVLREQAKRTENTIAMLQKKLEQKDVEMKQKLSTKDEETRIKLNVKQKEIHRLKTEMSRLRDERAENYKIIYEKMEPKRAAKILDEMDTGLAWQILSGMNRERAAEILGAMSSEKARLITERTEKKTDVVSKPAKEIWETQSLQTSNQVNEVSKSQVKGGEQ